MKHDHGRSISRRQFGGAVLSGIVAGQEALSELLSPAYRQSQRPRPSASQLAWQREELALFLHFGVNTFSDREWGDGKESPTIFAPNALDARQWARAAKAGGFKMMIL